MASSGAQPMPDDGQPGGRRSGPGDGGRPVHDRMAGLLARRLASAGHRAGEPISVAELHRTLLPYPLCREALNLATKGEYDLALLRLLSDPARLEVGEPALADAIEEELNGAEPGLAFLQDFAASSLHAVQPGGSDPGDESGGATAEADAEFLSELSGGSPEDGAETGVSDAESQGGRPPETRECRSCAGALPDRADVRFCPHCGEDQRRRRCEGCRTELESGWRYCPGCGRQTSGAGTA